MVGSVLSGIKISQAVAASQTAGTASFVTCYTVPANSYVIFNVRLSQGTSNVSMRVGGQDVYSGTTTQFVGVYAGPGQTIQVANPAASGTATMTISGVEFINTP